MEKSVQDAIERTKQRLCHVCRAILDDVHDHGTHHLTAIDCHQAAQLGCPICTIVWRHAVGDRDSAAILALTFDGTFSTWGVSTNKKGHYGRTHWPEGVTSLKFSTRSVCKARQPSMLENWATGGIQFVLISVSERPADAHHTVKSGSTDSEETWHQVQKWWARCNEEHSCSNRQLKDHDIGMSLEERLPSRVIDVGEDEDDTVRLVAKGEGPPLMPYVTLSHCWGGKSTLRLIDENLPHDMTGTWISSRHQEISLRMLPRTFRQAVEVVRRLKVRFLWIDSLCIIQNSRDDWEQESRNMGMIYKLSHCTIAADGSPDSEGGLFHKRDIASVDPLIVKPAWTDVEEPCSLIYAGLWRDSVTESLLGMRGWALQERYMAPTVIHFHQQQVLWECCEMECCETFPDGLPQYAADMGVRFKHDSAEAAKQLRLEYGMQKGDDDDEAEDQSLDTYYLWSRLIEKYTRTSLTREQDMLAAIFGLGLWFTFLINTLERRDSQSGDTVRGQGALQSQTDCNVSGLWYCILPSQLLWMVEDYRLVVVLYADDVWRNPAKSLARRPRGQHPSPSWSWASVVGPVVMPKPLRNGSLIEVVIDTIRAAEMVPEGPVTVETMENFPDIHEKLLLRVVAGRLYSGWMNYNTRYDHWLVNMNPDGVEFKHPQATASNIAFPVSTTGEEDQESSAGDRGDSSSGTSASPELEERMALAIAHLDTSDGVEAYDESTGFLPVMCLPVMNTRRCGKRALSQDMDYELSGISGLLLTRTGDGYPGCYVRRGVFHLLGDHERKLKVSPSTEDARFADWFEHLGGESGGRVVTIG